MCSSSVGSAEHRGLPSDRGAGEPVLSTEAKCRPLLEPPGEVAGGFSGYPSLNSAEARFSNCEEYFERSLGSKRGDRYVGSPLVEEANFRLPRRFQLV